MGLGARLGDRGGSLLEYAVVITLVAVVTALVPVTGVAGSVADHVRRAFCAALGGSDDCLALDPGAGGEEAAAACPRHTSEQGSWLRAQALVHYRGDTAVTRTEWADGSVWYTAQPWTDEVGAGVGAGGTVQRGKARSRQGWHAQVEGAYRWGHGMVWTFGPEERDEAAAFERELDADGAVGTDPARQWWRRTTGTTPELPTPDIRLTSEEFRAGGSAATSTGLLLDAAPGSDAAVDVGIGLGAALEANGQRTVSHDDRPTDPVRREGHSVSGSLSGEGEVILGIGGTGSLDWTAGIEEERDSHGTLLSIRLHAEHAYGGSLDHRMPFGVTGGGQVRYLGADTSSDASTQQARTLTVSVPVTDAAERQLGEDFLRRYPGTTGVFRYFWETMLDSPSDHAWSQLVRDRAHVWETVRERSSTEHTTGGTVYWRMIPIGAQYGEHTSETVTTDAWYLSASPTGHRVPFALPSCTGDT